MNDNIKILVSKSAKLGTFIEIIIESTSKGKFFQCRIRIVVYKIKVTLFLSFSAITTRFFNLGYSNAVT